VNALKVASGDVVNEHQDLGRSLTLQGRERQFATKRAVTASAERYVGQSEVRHGFAAMLETGAVSAASSKHNVAGFECSSRRRAAVCRTFSYASCSSGRPEQRAT
jgi:hypothetical protein